MVDLPGSEIDFLKDREPFPKQKKNNSQKIFWKQAYSAQHQKFYYYHKQTRQRRWEPPADFIPLKHRHLKEIENMKNYPIEDIKSTSEERKDNHKLSKEQEKIENWIKEQESLNQNAHREMNENPKDQDIQKKQQKKEEMKREKEAKKNENEKPEKEEIGLKNKKA